MAKVLITGSNRGIGLALAKKFLEQGDQVAATARRPEASSELAELRQRFGEKLWLRPMDVTDPSSVSAAATEAAAELGSIDILINNAGAFPEEGDEKLEELDLRHFDLAFAVNVTGVARVCQAFLPLLRKSTEARIVNISSGAGSIANKTDSEHYCYSSSKAALNMFTRALAAELKPERIIVVPISPGWVKTEMGGANAELTPDESAAGLVRAIKGLRVDQTGQFLDRQGRTGLYKW